jgi:hypothetical protein
MAEITGFCRGLNFYSLPALSCCAGIIRLTRNRARLVVRAKVLRQGGIWLRRHEIWAAPQRGPAVQVDMMETGLLHGPCLVLPPSAQNSTR